MNAGIPDDSVQPFSVLLTGGKDIGLRFGRDATAFYLETVESTVPGRSRDAIVKRTPFESRLLAAESASERLVSYLTRNAARSLAARGLPRWPLESALEKALLTGLSTTDGIARPRAFRDVPGWTPEKRPGEIDVIIDYGGHLRVGLELKLGEVGHSLWDIVKLINMVAGGQADASYAIVGAHDAEWAASRVGELFNPDHLLESSQVDLAELIGHCSKSWKSLLKSSAGAPVWAPSSFSATLVADFPVPDYPGMSLRALAVKPATTVRTEFIDGWPVTPS